MQQTNRGIYNKQESVGQMFLNSCLGKCIIMAALVAVVLLIAHLTVPADDEMNSKISNDIRLCIEENALAKSDKIDDVVRNATAIFAAPDSTADSTVMADFHKYNRIEVYRHTFYSTARIHNNLEIKGIRVGIGIFGMVIPTVNYGDLILQVGPVRKEYNRRIIENAYGDEDLGSNPDFGDTYNTYQGGGSNVE